jgi:hypothetical protein
MGAVTRWARAGSRWTLIWLALFAGIAGAAGILAGAGWSRTRGALPAFERFSRPADAAIAVDGPSAADPALLEQIVQAVGATGSLMIADVAVTLPRPDGTEVTVGAVASPVPAVGAVDRPRLVAGRLPDPSRSDELTMNESAAADLHVHAGSRIDVGLVAASQSGRSSTGEPTPLLGRIPMTVTGIVRYTADLEHQPNAQPGTEFATADERISLSDGFWHDYGSRVAIDFLGVAVTLPGGANDFARLGTATAQLSQGRFTTSLGDNFVPNRAALIRTIDLQAAAFLTVGLLAALAGAVLVAQAIARHVALRAADYRTLATLGMTRRQIIASEALTILPVAVGAALVAAVLAVAFSPLTPVGVARDAELQPGVHINWLVVSVGAAAIVAYAVAVAAVAAWASGRAHPQRPSRRSGLSSRLATAGVPPSLVAGSEFALRRQGRTLAAVRPVRVALAVGVVVVVGAWVVGGSLSHLLDSPAARGWAWDAQVGDITSPDSASAGARALDADPDVAGYAGELGGIYVPIDGHRTAVTVLDVHGDVATPIVLEGRVPSAADEIGLGRSTLEALHKHIGDFVTTNSPEGQDLQLRIVATIVPMSAVDTLESFGEGALIPYATAKRAAGPNEPLIPSAFLVTFHPGVDRSAAMTRLEQLFPRTVLVAPSSVDVDTLRRVDWLPVGLAGFVGLLTVGTLAHLIITSVRRHRRDFGVLRALGFTNRQIGSAIVAMAVMVALVMVLVGVPVGVVAGRLAWRMIAGGLGTEAHPTVPARLLTVVPLTVVVAALTALWPARRTVKHVPAEALRVE